MPKCRQKSRIPTNHGSGAQAMLKRRRQGGAGAGGVMEMSGGESPELSKLLALLREPVDAPGRLPAAVLPEVFA